ncbi:uncharacterized protein BDZ99DRAFT_466491 [Mytilinidion resinicola]|uniref:RlpA-like protein double-psi beta-barrel domain-containing protein n=1 Tax=Mytilinidion resinicola TaxID=574789 RepID=A0A6A6Y9X1_9PEZI|nr:uncharacterized protein BDZ99DRAFT_466491 [Mytilinidion resinicola]KAF2805500.1 hypothetical protein BDZ99DRAFT_466491 [Mytilinidion resinicola]
MSTEELKSPPQVPRKELPPTYQRNGPAPEWEAPLETGRKPTNIKLGAFAGASTTLTNRFNRLIPPHKKYFGRSRRVFLICLGILFLALLALIIGLAVGLGHKKQHRNLPLPNGAKTYTGDLTYYGPGLGACGTDSNDNSAIVSISHFVFDAVQKGSNPNANPLCFRKIRAQRQYKGGLHSVDLTVVDRCTGCEPNDLDVSPGMFAKLADPDQGRVTVTWAWL